MFFLDSFSSLRSKSPSLRHISAGKDLQPTGINRPFLAAPRLEDVHTGTHAHFPVELVKQAAPRQRCDGEGAELQLQFS